MTTGYQLTQLVDTGPLSKTVGADGKAQVTFGPVQPEHIWNVFRILVASNSVLAGPAEVYFDDWTVETNLRAGTGTGQGDIDSNERLIVPSTITLVIAWQDMTPGASCWAILQYEDLLAVQFTGSSIPGPVVSGGTG